MGITAIERVISEKNIVVFSPHYDDFPLFISGYIAGLKDKDLLDIKRFTSVLVFGRSNYTVGAEQANYDTSLERIKVATGQRFIEDTECMNEMLGCFNYSYECCLENEALVREKVLADSTMEFPSGTLADFNEEDQEIFERITRKVMEYATQEDTAILFPLAIKEHIDHVIVREAAFNAIEKSKGKVAATFYFCEDKPYYGIATKEERKKIEAVIEARKLRPITYTFNAEAMIELVFKHYISQVEDVYSAGIRARARELKNIEGEEKDCDRMYVLDKVK